MNEKIIYKNLEDGPPCTPISQEIYEYFIEHYADKGVSLNANVANDIAEILRKQGVDV